MAFFNFKILNDNSIKLLDQLNDIKKESEITKNTLKFCIDYLDSNLNKNSATDTTCLSKLKNLYDKYSYLEKYLKILLDFYSN